MITNSSRASIALSVYVAATLISMAVMSCGLLAVLAASFLIWPNWDGWLAAIRAESSYRYSKIYMRFSALLFAAITVSLSVASIWPFSLPSHEVEVSFARDLLKSWYLALPIFLVVILRKLGNEGIRKVITVWLTGMALLSIVGVIQHYTGLPRTQILPMTFDPILFHATLFLGHHLSVASIWIFPTFVALDLALRKDGPAWVKMSRSRLWVFGCLGLSTLFLTYSRMAWLSLPFGLLVLVFSLLPFKRALSTCLGLFLMGAVALQMPAVQSRFQLPRLRYDLRGLMGVVERQRLWSAHSYFFTQRPLTGVGWLKGSHMVNSYYTDVLKVPSWKHFMVGHAHNNLLEMLSGTGLLGASAWLLWVLLPFAILIRLVRRRIPMSGGLLAAWAMFHLNGLTQVNFWEGKVLHQIMWMMALVLFLASETLANPTQTAFRTVTSKRDPA